ncbi:putative neutral sphingomyelinase [Lepeophtheirus salmonis]|uniref:putative neutral sphingomyelinase n=1 Tax=Lepeophtheirus salmonis TaxID=72036 RepID=UPI001AE0FBBC|nr:putative neutral sphingomyelinase [Lepeophtheirus salmonis]
MEEDWKEIKVFSLNFFGLYGISAKRKERVQALSHYLSAKEDYDIVLLQEVWTDEDYKTLKKNLILSGGPFKFSHYFDNGIIGTGTCIFSKSRIRFTTFHSFGLNGYPQSISHGDWFAAKGLGIAVLYIDGFEIHVYVSHYHAEYNPENDIYLGHRVVHALESAQWIQLTSASADLTIYAGDFNTEPDKVPLKLLKYITSLKDSWEEVHGSNANEEGATCETYYNSFTPESVKQACPEGKRIDYIMYQAGADTDVVTKDCILPLSKRVPGKNYSYSDHEAVESTFRIKRKMDSNKCPLVDYKRSLSVKCQSERFEVVTEALEIIHRSEGLVSYNGTKYLMIASGLLILLILSLLPSLIESSIQQYMDLAMFFPRLIVTIIMTFYLIMGFAFNRRELNELRSTKSSLKVIFDLDKLCDESSKL